MFAAIPPKSGLFQRPVVSASTSATFLPKEHGSWSLALEPIALGLLVAPGPAGAALATAAFAGFFARRPLKAALAPAATERRHAARITLVLLATLAAAGLFEALVLGGLIALWPLLFAAPFAAMFVNFDSQNDSRAAAAELAGSATFAFLPAAFATLAGWTPDAALALAAVALARGVPTVLTVRAYLRSGKGEAAGTLVPIPVAGVAVILLFVLAQKQLVPWLAAGFATFLLVRSAWLVSSLRPVWPARRVGLIEAVLGGLYVGGLALAYRL